MYSDRYNRSASRAAQRGVSLVEIMVGAIIAMIGVVIIFQMLANSEERKRTSTAGSDVQVSGVIAVTSIERDIREAGYGYSSASYDNAVTPVMGCTVNAYDGARPVPKFTFRLAPVIITQGAGNTSDTVTIFRGNGSAFPASYQFSESTDTSKKTRGRAGITPRDFLLVAATSPALQCMLVEITDVSNPDALTINHGLGNYNYPVYMPDGSTVTQTRIARNNDPAPTTAFTAGIMFNLGNGARRNIWSVNSGKLQVTNDLLYQDTDGDGNNDPVEVADSVVSLQAEYGIDANNNGRIESGEWTTVDPATTAQWANVLAIRLGLLMRSSQYERTIVTTALPGWTGGSFTITNLDGSVSTSTPASPADNWRNYRYRVYETVIPLRNILWGSNISP